MNDLLATLPYSWLVGAVAALVGVGATIAERLRLHRRARDRVGFMPWTGIAMAAVFVVAGALISAVR